MSRENVEAIRLAYDAFNKGDSDPMFALLDDEFTYRARAELPGGGAFEGVEAFRSRIAELEEVFAELRFEPQEIIDAREHVVVVLCQIARGRSSGAGVEQPIVHVWRIEAGRGKELRVYGQRAEALEAVGLRE